MQLAVRKEPKLPNGSFYFRDNPAFKGGSPQAVYEELWERGRKARLIQRGFVAAVFLLAGARLMTPAWGVVFGMLGFGLATAWHWWMHSMHSVWLRGQRGERRTNSVLRYTLELRGYRVLHGRSVPDFGNLDQLVVGPTGVWVIGNQAWSPDTEFAVYGGRLFVDKALGTPEVPRLAEAADTVSRLITERLTGSTTPLAAQPAQADDAATGPRVSVKPVLTVYGGRLPRGVVSEGVTLARSYRLPRLISRSGAGQTRLTREEIQTITQAAIRALPIGDHTMVTR
jgi:hypothetical protein